MLEQILARRRHAALEDEARGDETAKRVVKNKRGEFRDRSQQLVGKLATDRGPDLGGLL